MKLASDAPTEDGDGVKRALTIWLVGDGKPGHENQSLGLAEAMDRLQPCEVHRISIASESGLFGRLRKAMAAAKYLPSPDLVMGAGHATHLSILRLARKYRARSVVIMRPSLPISWFGHVICPEHDFPNGTKKPNVILTRGAMNRIVPSDQERDGKLILLGGPSKTHGWDRDAMIQMLERVSDRGGWALTDSRRTPAGFLDELSQRLPGVTIFPHQDTASVWLPDQLCKAKEVWVSEDSVSMIYEALTSGAKVGLLPVPRLKKQSRVLAGVDGLIEKGYLMTFADWEKDQRLSAAVARLSEADRCAAELLKA